MSKRVANTKERTARNGRIRIGWRKRRMLTMLDKQEEQARMGKLDDEAKEKFEAFKKQVRRLIPKQILRRAQGR